MVSHLPIPLLALTVAIPHFLACAASHHLSRRQICFLGGTKVALRILSILAVVFLFLAVDLEIVLGFLLDRLGLVQRSKVTLMHIE
jgi:hypothetical protein